MNVRTQTTHTRFFVTLAAVAVAFLVPIIALAQGSSGTSTGFLRELIDAVAPLFTSRTAHAWVALAAGVIVTLLAVSLKGGKLMWPILLIGLGALVSASLGLFPDEEQGMRLAWVASLVFNLAVVLGIFWMGRILGVFRSRRKK